MKWLIVFIGFSLYSQESNFYVTAYQNSISRNSATIFNDLPKQDLYNLNTDYSVFLFNHHLYLHQVTVDWNVLYSSHSSASFETTIRELYVEFSINDHTDVHIGRKKFRSGVGYYKNPAAFFDNKRQSNDVDDQLKSNIGRDVISMNHFFDDSNLEWAYSPTISRESGQTQIENHSLFIHYYQLIYDSDVSVFLNIESEYSNRIGFSFANTLSDHLEFHTELAYQRRSSLLRHAAIFDSKIHIYESNPYEDIQHQSDVMTLLIGINYTFSNGLHWISEYSYDKKELTQSQWERITTYVKSIRRFDQQIYSTDAINGNIKWAALSMNSMRHQWFNRFAQSWESASVSIISILNIADYSSILIPELTYNFNWMNVRLSTIFFLGKRDSVFGSLLYSTQLQLQLYTSL